MNEVEALSRGSKPGLIHEERLLVANCAARVVELIHELRVRRDLVARSMQALEEAIAVPFKVIEPRRITRPDDLERVRRVLYCDDEISVDRRQLGELAHARAF